MRADVGQFHPRHHRVDGGPLQAPARRLAVLFSPGLPHRVAGIEHQVPIRWLGGVSRSGGGRPVVFVPGHLGKSADHGHQVHQERRNHSRIPGGPAHSAPSRQRLPRRARSRASVPVPQAISSLGGHPARRRRQGRRRGRRPHCPGRRRAGRDADPLKRLPPRGGWLLCWSMKDSAARRGRAGTLGTGQRSPKSSP